MGDISFPAKTGVAAPKPLIMVKHRIALEIQAIQGFIGNARRRFRLGVVPQVSELAVAEDQISGLVVPDETLGNVLDRVTQPSTSLGSFGLRTRQFRLGLFTLGDIALDRAYGDDHSRAITNREFAH